MDIYEVFARRTHDDPLVHAGSIKAQDLEMALILARETHFRHGEGAECWVVRRQDLHSVSHPETMGGVTDRSYRRQDGYVGVGAKLKRVTEELKKAGKSIVHD
ncbi:MAG: 1,2-phenylacetyl-CoA epoxidase subunit PaaB [Actinomycetota bacterium]